MFLSDLNKLHVDIWVGRKDGTNLKIKTCTGHYIFPMRFVEEKKTGILRNKEFPIPKDYDTLLERVYGEDWKTPIKNKHPICELDKEYE